MDRHGLQLEVWNNRHSLVATPPSAWAGLPAQLKDKGLANTIDEMALVLRMLIERFGGEATNTALMKQIVLERTSTRGNDTTSCAWLGHILDELTSCAAITLENMDEAEVIARVAPYGVALAYQ